MRPSAKAVAFLGVGPVALSIGTVVPAHPARSGAPADAKATTCPSPSGASVVQSVRVPGRPGFLLLSRNTLWVAIAAPDRARERSHGAVVRVDARSGEVQRVLRLPLDPYQLAFGFGSLWVTGYTTDRKYQDRLLRIDPNTGRVVRAIRGPRVLGSKIASTSDAVWINGADIFPRGHTDRAGVRFVYKVDPRRNAVVRRVRLPSQATVIDLLGAGSSLWSVGWWGVVKLSASGRVLFHRRIDGFGWWLALTRGTVWVAQPWFGSRPVRKQNHPARRLLRIATSGRPRHEVIELETQPGGLAAAGEIVWIGANGGLALLDTTAAAATLTKVPVPFVPNYLAAFPGGVWASEQQANRVSKIC